MAQVKPMVDVNPVIEFAAKQLRQAKRAAVAVRLFGSNKQNLAADNELKLATQIHDIVAKHFEKKS